MLLKFIPSNASLNSRIESRTDAAFVYCHGKVGISNPKDGTVEPVRKDMLCTVTNEESDLGMAGTRNRKLSLQKLYMENEPKRKLIKAFRGWKLYIEKGKSKRTTYELLVSQSRLRRCFHGWRIKFQHQLDKQFEAVTYDYSTSLRNSFIRWTNQAAKSRLMRASECAFQLRRKKRLVGVMLKSWNQLSTNSARLKKTSIVITRQHNFILLDHSWYIWNLALRLRRIKELESQFNRIRRDTCSSTLKRRCLLNWKHALQFRKQQKRRSERVFIRNFKFRYFNRWQLKTQELQYKFEQVRNLHNRNILHASFQQWLERVKHERIKRKEVVIRAWLKDVKSRQLRLMIRGWRNVTRKNAYKKCLLAKVTAQRNEIRIRHAFRIWNTVTFEAKSVRESLEKANYNRRQQYLRRWVRVHVGIRERNNQVIIGRQQFTQRNAFMKWYSRFLQRKRAEQTMERFLLRKKQAESLAARKVPTLVWLRRAKPATTDIPELEE
ncbi:hypothetical protein BKA69DRAFT_1034559 [Paraphysoderma sedebokerense]|nr:hypothetical protein BKA69DRAFT_1034559 [Paraphysoderma sedebokerense]